MVGQYLEFIGLWMFSQNIVIICNNRSFDPNINDLRNDRACQKDWILGTVEVTDGLAICIVCSAN